MADGQAGVISLVENKTSNHCIYVVRRNIIYKPQKIGHLELVIGSKNVK